MAAGTITDSELTIFLEHRRLLFSVAYRMMGSAIDAEDIVQESYLRWRKASSNQKIRDAKSLLVSITTRLCIDEWKKARRKREVYIGPFLSEPVPTAMLQSELHDDRIDHAFLLLLEQLKPVERAIFVLKEAFDYSYAEIAGIVQKSEAACRQIFSRARRSIDVNKTPVSITRTQELLLQRYLTALSTADAKLLLSVIAEDAQIHSDGGGVAGAARRVVHGRIPVAALLLGVTRKGGSGEVYTASVNGMPAIVIYRDGRPVLVQCLAMDAQIRTLFGILNPKKLAAFKDRERLIREGVLSPVRFTIAMQLRWIWNRWIGRHFTVPMLRRLETETPYSRS